MYFTHLALPHWPWIHLPDGRPFALPSSLPANDGPGWGPDPWLVEQAYQRHLFQVQYADAIVGQIIARLEKHGSYDDALIIVMADHGVTIRPGVLNRRAILPETVGDVAAVPLFVKQPGQQQGGVDDYRAESVDILPTIAALLEVDVPWSTDGVSLFGADRPRRVTSTMISKQGSVTFGTTGAEKLEVVEYHQAYFGGRGPFGIAPLGQADLLGLEVTKLAPSDLATVSVTLDKPDWYSALDIGSDTLFPALMSGTVSGDMEGDVVLAIALNGRVAAVTRTWEAGDKVRFQAMIPIEMLAAGPNAVDILAVEGSGIDRTLWRLGVRPIGQSPPTRVS